MSAAAKTLASDAFQGRAPATSLAQAKMLLTLSTNSVLSVCSQGGENGGWCAAMFPLVRNVASFAHAARDTGWRVDFASSGRDINPQTAPLDFARTISDARMVFVGYGSRRRNEIGDDFKGVDLHGQGRKSSSSMTPDFEAGPDEPVAGKFGGRAMTYYGRWTYKFEEAAWRAQCAHWLCMKTAVRLWMERSPPTQWEHL